MIIPNKEDVVDLEAYKSEDFSKWFIAGFRDIKRKEKHEKPFAPLSLYFGRFGAISELKYIYDLLSGGAKIEFCEGVNLALSIVAKEADNTEVVRNLLLLSGIVNAVQVIPTVVMQIGNGFFGLDKSDDLENDLFAVALNVISGMSPCYYVKEAVCQMVASNHYQYQYAPMAFIALCETEKDEFPEHLNLLRSDFAKLNSEGIERKDAYVTAVDFAKTVDLKTIADNLHKLSLTLYPGIDEKMTDNWIVRLILTCEKSQIKLKSTEKGFSLIRKENDCVGEKEYDIRLNPANIENYFDLIEFFENIIKDYSYNKNTVMDVCQMQGNEINNVLESFV